MTQEYYSIITNGGLAKHAAASIGGDPIDLTHLAVGDSNATPYNPVATATALQNELHRTSITYVEIDEENPNQIIVEAIIDEAIGPFYVREVGIFDSEGDLFAIGKFPETFKPNLPLGSGKRLYVRMILAFTGTPQVTLIQSENLNYDPNFSSNVFDALSEKLNKAQNLADVEDALEARVNLGLEIGVNIQEFAQNLAAFAALIGTKNKIPYFTGAGNLAIANLFSNKNTIINGAFEIWQRGDSFFNVSVGQHLADRWGCILNGAMRFDISRSNDVPTISQAGRKFNYSLLVDCTVADNSIATTEYFCLRHVVEGYNYAPLAEQIFTLSFWVKATKTGIYSVSAKPSSNDASCVLEYSIEQADTWEFKTLTFPAPLPDNGSWNYSNGWGIEFLWSLAQGSTYQTDVLGQWQNTNYSASTNQVNACDNVSNNFKITGVQMEQGNVSTPFEIRSIQKEIELCQRYYQKSYNLLVSPGTSSNYSGMTEWFAQIGSGTGGIFCSYQFKTRMRTTPTITPYDYLGNPGKITMYDASVWRTKVNNLTAQINYASESGFTAGASPNANPAKNGILFHYTANAEF